MKKLNISFFTLCAIVLNAATTNAWEWPWNKYKWQASTNQSWKEYGTQKGKAILLGIKNHPKTTLISIGGLVLAYKYRALRSLWIGNYQFEQEQIKADIKEYWALWNKKEQWDAKDQEKFYNLYKRLSTEYQSYSNIGTPHPTQAQTLELLQEWYHNYLENKPNRSDEEEIQFQFLATILSD